MARGSPSFREKTFKKLKVGELLSGFEGQYAYLNGRRFLLYNKDQASPSLFPPHTPEEWPALQKAYKVKGLYRGALQRHRAMRVKDSAVGEFDLTIMKIKALVDATPICPVTRLPLRFVVGDGNGKHHPQSPTIDKLVPSLGYVDGNCAILSHRGNQLKSDHTRATYNNLGAYLEANGI
ncbi:hypothetical protein TrCOL_g7778 [Triparma columacea]|uniref:Uncharacterized protein n=1 Tax=Triparma columacea TaxID=722753 RepID=A0A9W7GKB1_9STRA|nr:hypothetical protein TrCOL_g7778 [Triparma columacea]